MPESRLEYLFNCYIQNDYTPRQAEELMLLLAQSENDVAVQKLISDLIENTGPEIQMTDQVAASILKNIFQEGKKRTVPIKKRNTGFTFWKRVMAWKKRLFHFEYVDINALILQIGIRYHVEIIYAVRCQCNNNNGS